MRRFGLTTAQQVLLGRCVAAAQRVPGQEFACRVDGRNNWLEHPGWMGGPLDVDHSDLFTLEALGLIRFAGGAARGRFELTPAALERHAQLG